MGHPLCAYPMMILTLQPRPSTTIYGMWLVVMLLSAETSASQNPPHLDLVHALPSSLINSSSAGASDLKYGFEGGMALHECGKWHLFMTEMWNDPHWISTRLAHWQSNASDAFSGWHRQATLKQGSGNTNGTDDRSHVDAPMIVLNPASGFYELFYVAYWHGTPNCSLSSCNGSLWRAVATKKGCEGIGGPFTSDKRILAMDSQAQPWEGDQGDDSISPPRLISPGLWASFYGSSKETSFGHFSSGREWNVGLMTASSLQGPWTRRPSITNPVLGPQAENPVVSPVPAHIGGLWKWVAVFDWLPHEINGSIGVTWSQDGLSWSSPQLFNVHSQITSGSVTKSWTQSSRTPQGLVFLCEDGVAVANSNLTNCDDALLFYTAPEQLPPPHLKFDWDAVGVSTVRVKRPPEP